MHIIIRAARPADLPVLKSFEQGIVKAERPYDETLSPDPISYYDIDAMIGSDQTEVAVAEIGDELVGSGYIQKRRSREYVDNEYHGFIGFLYVVPEHRGKGINKQVLSYLFDWATRQGLPDVHLTVYPDNKPAVRAYEKAGFTPHLLEMRMKLKA